jgi:serine protease Do
VSGGSLTGTYEYDAVAGLLRRTNTAVDSASLAVRMTQTGARSPSTLHWISRDTITLDAERWTRQVASRGWLGVATPTNGAPVTAIAANSPAASIGLRAGDVIVELDGKPVQNGAAFRAAYGSRKPGDRVQLGVSRDGAVSNLTATLATGSDGAGSLGVTIAIAGAVVSQVQPGTPAERAGLRAGDLIEAVNGKNLEDGADLVRTIQALAPGTEAMLTVVRNDTRLEQRVVIGKLPG